MLKKHHHTKPKIAIFYDWLNCWGGAERLLLNILAIYPQSILFTTIYDKSKTNWLPPKTKIHQALPMFKKNSPLVGLLQAMAVENLNFSNFDIVISLTSLNGKAIITPPSTLHICYCLNPNRYLYQKTYPKITNPLITKLKKNDFIYSRRPDTYLTISRSIQTQVKTYYQLPSTIIYPCIDTNKFIPTQNQSPQPKYFLIVCRLVPHKKVNLVINSFQNTKHKLYIVGTGRQQNQLKKLAQNNQNIKFLGKVSDQKLVKLYQNCQALICPQSEDFGLTPLEVQACGKPVIAFNRGGITETVIHLKTGILFNKQTTKNLKRAIKLFGSTNIDSKHCRHQALKFSNKNFMLNFNKQINKLWLNHQKRLQTIS